MIHLKLITLLSIIIIYSASCTTSKQPISYVKIGNNYVKKGLYTEAINQYKIAIRKNQDLVAAQTNLGIVLSKIGDCANAIFHLKAADISKPKLFEAKYYLSHCYAKLGTYMEALIYGKKALRIKPNDARTRTLLAWIYFQTNKTKKSIRQVNHALKRNPYFVAANIIKAKNLIKKKDFPKALTILQKTIKYTKSSQDKSYVYSTMGEYFFEKKDYSQATHYHEQSLRLKPFGYDSLIGLGKIYIQNKRIEKAAKTLIKAINLEKTNPIAYFYMAKIYQKRDRRQSINYFKKFLALSNNSVKLAKEIKLAKRSIRKWQNKKRR